MAGTDRRSRLGPAASADIGQRNYFCLASPVTSVTANAREQRRNKVGNRDRKPCVELKRGSDEIGLRDRTCGVGHSQCIVTNYRLLK